MVGLPAYPLQRSLIPMGVGFMTTTKKYSIRLFVFFFPQAKQNLGPGEYDLKSFLHELQGRLHVSTVLSR